MESSRITPADAAAALAKVDRSRDDLARGVRLPRGFHSSLGAAIAVQIATAAYGAAEQTLAGFVVLGAGALAFLLVAALQLRAFRGSNGVWLGGLASRVVFGTGTEASVVYTAALGFAVWAAFSGQWWLVGLLAAAGGAGYAWAGVRWVRTYRADPVEHGRGESALVLALFALTILLAGAMLLVNR